MPEPRERGKGHTQIPGLLFYEICRPLCASQMPPLKFWGVFRMKQQTKANLETSQCVRGWLQSI